MTLHETGMRQEVSESLVHKIHCSPWPSRGLSPLQKTLLCWTRFTPMFGGFPSCSSVFVPRSSPVVTEDPPESTTVVDWPGRISVRRLRFHLVTIHTQGLITAQL